MHANAAASSAESSARAAGLRGRLDSSIPRLGRFPVSVHQVLFRLAFAGVFFRAGLQKARGWETT
jgi:hypothetical protein